MKASRLVALLVGALLVVAAVWWLLREPLRAPADDAAVLQRAAASDEGAEAPAFAASVPDASGTPIALDAAAPARGDVTAAGAEVTAANALQLTVVHASGAPAAGATVVLEPVGAPPATGLTDAAGRVRLLPSADGVEGADSAGDADNAGDGFAVVVGGVSDVPQRVTLKAGSGEQRVMLPDGLRVEGQVFVDGVPLREPLLLALEALPKPRKSRIPGIFLYSALYSVTPGQAQGSRFNAQVVAPGGHFEFSCLPEGWTGRFMLSDAFECAGGEEALQVHAPALGLQLRLSSLPTVRGRVMEPGGGASVPGAGVSFRMTNEGGAHASSLDCDADGRFAIPITGADGALKAMSLQLTHPLGSGFLELTLSAEDVNRNPDLGDLRLLPARAPLHFIVRDADGAPVPGAIAKAEDTLAARSTKTDDDGRGELRGLPPETATVTVWAHRFFGQTVSLPDAGVVTDAGHPLLVVLERCPSLDVIVKGADGKVPKGLRVAVVSEQALFSSADTIQGQPQYKSFLPDPMVYEVGMTASTGATFKVGTAAGVWQASGSAQFTPDGAGRVSLSNLLPNVPFDLLVQDEADNPAWGPESLILKSGEARVVEAVIAHDAADLVIHVTDPLGAPLERAYVGVVSSGKDGDSRTSSATNAEGFVTLKRIFIDTVTLAVDKEGYVTRQVEDVAVMRDAPLDVVLQPGRQVRVFVHDTQGRPVPADHVQALLGEQHVGGASPDDGTQAGGPRASAAKPASGAGVGAASSVTTSAGHARWLAFDLPLGDLTFEARVGGRRFTTRQSSAVPGADIVVPDVGALFVHCGFALDPGLDYTLMVTPTGGSADLAVKHWLNPMERATGEVRIPALVPDSYALSLVTWATGAQVPCARPVTVEVTAGATAVVQLEAP